MDTPDTATSAVNNTVYKYKQYLAHNYSEGQRKLKYKFTLPSSYFLY
jgi:hypothetical protein